MQEERRVVRQPGVRLRGVVQSAVPTAGDITRQASRCSCRTSSDRVPTARSKLLLLAVASSISASGAHQKRHDAGRPMAPTMVAKNQSPMDTPVPWREKRAMVMVSQLSM